MKKALVPLLIFLIAILSACGKPIRTDSLIVYPDPPEEPRLAYIGSYHGSVDFRSVNFLDYLLGFDARSDLTKPYGVAAQGDRMYISLTGSPSICVIDTKEQKVSFMGNRDPGRLTLPLGLALSADGRVFVADAKTKRIFGFDAKGELKTAIGGESVFNNPAAVAINDELGRLYVVDSYAHNVRVFSLKGETLFDFGKRGNGEGEFNFPSNLAVDKRNGNVVVVDTQNFRVQIFDKDGKFLRKFGRLGDQVGNFSRPKGVGVDSEGNIYVSDAAFDNFQVFDEQGQVLLFIGRAGMDPGNFQLPAGLFVDDKDRIYVVDSLNARVQVFQYMSEKWKRANPEQYEKYRFKQAGTK